MPVGRLNRGLKDLVSGGDIARLSQKRFSMTTEQRERYRLSIDQRLAFLEEVETEWLDAMQRTQRCRTLSGAESTAVLSDFRGAVGRLCEARATAVGLFLQGDATQLQPYLIAGEVKAYLSDEDGRTAELIRIERKIFPLFFGSEDPKRATYVAGIAQACLRRKIFTVEVEGGKLLENRLKDLRLVLDTNMIFSLVGLDGEKQQDTLEHLIDMNSELGIETCVDRRSIREFLSVLGNSRRLGLGPRVPVQVLGQVKRMIEDGSYKPSAAIALPEDPFTLRFWASLEESYAKSASRSALLADWERFLIKYQSVEIVLNAKYGVSVVKETDTLEVPPERRQEIEDRLMRAAGGPKSKKTQNAIEHDATMFFLIQSLRQNEAAPLLPANHWLLSADKSLSLFTRELRTHDNTTIEHFVRIASWFELLMPFLTMRLVDEADEALVVARSLGQGFVHYRREGVSGRDLAEVMRRVPEADERGPELVLRCAANRHFMETVHSAVEHEGVTAQTIDEAVARAFEEVKSDASLADAELKAEVDRLTQTADGLRSELADACEKGKTASQELHSERRRGTILLTFVVLAVLGFTAWIAYRAHTEAFSWTGLSGIAWGFGTGCIPLAVFLALRRQPITSRILLIVYLLQILCFGLSHLAASFGDASRLAISIGVSLSALGVLVTLLKQSWLDIRIAAGR